MADMDDSMTNYIYDEKTEALFSYTEYLDVYMASLPVVIVNGIYSGSSAQIVKVRCKDSDTILAAKDYILLYNDNENNDRKKTHFFKETAMLQDFHHENILTWHYSIMCPRRCMLIMDHCPGGALSPNFLTDEQVKKYFFSILDAVQYIHGKRIIHRDIKLENILMKAGDVLLSDFKISKKLPEGKGHQLVSGCLGTEEYMAPEVYRADESSVYDGFKADSYSLGVYLWCLLNRAEPPCEEDKLFRLDRILKRSKEFRSMDHALTDCAVMLLMKNPRKRVSATTLWGDLAACGHLESFYEVWECDDDGDEPVNSDVVASGLERDTEDTVEVQGSDTTGIEEAME